MENSFIIQTANDYDMPIHEVERIYKAYPNTFYQELENYIKQRASQ